MERMLEAFKTNTTPAQAMKFSTVPKDTRRSWSEHYMYLVAVSEACGGGANYLVLNNIVQYASVELRTVLMVKVEAARTDYLQQAEVLAHFDQSWGLEPSRHRNLGREVVAAVGEHCNQETRACHGCGEVVHLRAACPDRGRGREPDLTLAVCDESTAVEETWIQAASERRVLVGRGRVVRELRGRVHTAEWCGAEYH
ncbi:hypothetical protein PC120_g1949 [Phytophthora cactorum]|nr:hypothetical protein PC120_g1949 [Phytophthora cactorum]